LKSATFQAAGSLLLILVALVSTASGCGDDPEANTASVLEPVPPSSREELIDCLIPIYRERQVPPGMSGSEAAAACLGVEPAVLQSNTIYLACIVASTVRDPISKIGFRLNRCDRILEVTDSQSTDR
jgi:hypothetical protein